ncbi:MAG: hypothetical protein WDN69_10645 [Aliidongia sp.]
MSDALEDGISLPVRFTDDGEKLSPPLVWTGRTGGDGGCSRPGRGSRQPDPETARPCRGARSQRP